mgnify:CR=1 FL=1
MPQVKIHLSQETKTNEPLLAGEIREALVEVLGIKENIGQVIIYKTPSDCRSIHKSRDRNFVFVEINMYSGRSQEMKKMLLDKICILINKHTNIDLSEIICCVIEIPPENYYGGL